MITLDDPEFSLPLKQLGDGTRHGGLLDQINNLGLEAPVILAVNPESMQFADMVRNLLGAFYNVRFEVEGIGCQQVGDEQYAVHDLPAYPSIRKKGLIILNAAVDTGATILAVQDYLDFRYHNIKSMHIGAMVVKGVQEVVAPEMTVFATPQDAYVVGFGLEYNGKHSELEGIRGLTREEKKEKKEKKPHPNMARGKLNRGMGGPGQIVTVKR
jgi:hypoxanthine-guanine phosphoribosyltransferase